MTLQRVRLLVRPPTDYTRFELPFHREALKYGDDIRVIEEPVFTTLVVPRKDYWLVDDATVLLLNYDAAGAWLGFELSHNSQLYTDYKNLLLEHATPLNQIDL